MKESRKFARAKNKIFNFKHYGITQRPDDAFQLHQHEIT